MKRPRQQEAVRWSIALLAALLVVLLGSGLWMPDGYWRAVSAIDDWRHRLNASTALSKQVAVVDIDEQSLATIGPWPWPRALQAHLLDLLFDHEQAAVVGLDIVLPESQTVTSGDAQLLKLAQRHPLVFAQAFDFTTGGRAPATGNLSGAQAMRPAMRHAPQADGYIGNFFDAQSQPCTGHITPRPDQDGTVRSIAPFIRHEGSLYPMLALQMIHCAPLRTGQAQADMFSLAAMLSPARDTGHAAIPFHRARDGFEVIPAIDVLAGKVPAGKLAGRYVLVGSSALGLSDRIATPIDPWLPGVMVHAELLDWLLNEQPAPASRADLSWLPWLWAMASIALFATAFSKRKAWSALAVVLAATVAWCGLALSLGIAKYPMRIDLPLVVTAVFLLILAPIEWIAAQSRARAFEQRFQSYLSPAVLRELLADGKLAVFEPRRRQITVLFVDIVGYTTLAEDMEPETLVKLTDVILTRLTEHVYATEGTLDKYIGDALMAFWGAPVDMPDHADRAVACARSMIDGMARLNAEIALAFPGAVRDKPIRIRIGVNSGEAVVGEIGSAVRRSYTAIGDVVNTASRLQDLAKDVDRDLLIGTRTAALCREHALMPLMRATLRGRNQQEDVHVVESASVQLLNQPPLPVPEAVHQAA